MRLDRFLKVSRIIKRRTMAKEVCDNGRVSVNGRAAKPGAEIKVGDLLELDFGSKRIKIEVLGTPNTVRVDQAKDLYRTIEEIKVLN